MASKSSPAKSLKKLAAEIPDDEIVRKLLQSLEPKDNAYADHAIALIGASIVDKALEVAIRSRMVKLDDDEHKRIFSFDHRGPLADLSSRIKIAFALGVYGPRTRADLEHVRDIRNAFAHSISLIRFDAPEVAGICKLLHTPETTTILTSVADRGTPRGRYIETTVKLAGRLKLATEKAPISEGVGGQVQMWKRHFQP